jgi:hypothetical protein
MFLNARFKKEKMFFFRYEGFVSKGFEKKIFVGDLKFTFQQAG